MYYFGEKAEFVAEFFMKYYFSVIYSKPPAHGVGLSFVA